MCLHCPHPITPFISQPVHGMAAMSEEAVQGMDESLLWVIAGTLLPSHELTLI